MVAGFVLKVCVLGFGVKCAACIEQGAGCRVHGA